MPHRERHRDRGARRARASLVELGRELRDARRAAGLRQADVARAAGVSASWVSRVENAAVRDLGIRSLSVMLAIVGLDMSVRAFPGGQPLRDEGHRRLLAGFRAILPQGTEWHTEVPLAASGDPRAWDGVARLWQIDVGVEAEVRPTDLQALERKLGLKKRDSGVTRLILVLADTGSNRAFLRWAADDLKRHFPLQGRQALDALHDPQDPGVDLFVLVPLQPATAGRRSADPGSGRGDPTAACSPQARK